MTNVIEFSKAKKKKEESTQEIPEEEQIADFATSVVCDILEMMSEMGYDIRNNKESIRDTFATIESIRAIMHRTKNEKFPFHALSDSMFEGMYESIDKTEEELMEDFIESLELDLD